MQNEPDRLFHLKNFSKLAGLTAVVFSQLLFFADESFDTIIHILNKVDFVSTESSQVGDIEDTVIGFGMLTVNTSDLDVVLVGDGLHECLLFHEFWKMDMH